ncbi:hypothetical protein CONPUDRAFT_168617 [Coniophora puteana RWD-64-598 SS2]|uniref:Uncharacterized protein n=1 Tax=Coniophora puteana (strain RWD-64-598) TaxID=741705 RepID=A0A5M3MDG7_CONPW|nr:uncharacterized protein CONPUDRAFT_168617 [Coniophora puteana RWD-64-598 SS2]EIW76884.1 hypothetical protein CONPUDRAFT_168617 [Coniophora puteana RWD-64-598 SS2]
MASDAAAPAVAVTQINMLATNESYEDPAWQEGAMKKIVDVVLGSGKAQDSLYAGRIEPPIPESKYKNTLFVDWDNKEDHDETTASTRFTHEITMPILRKCFADTPVVYHARLDNGSGSGSGTSTHSPHPQAPSGSDGTAAHPLRPSVAALGRPYTRVTIARMKDGAAASERRVEALFAEAAGGEEGAGASAFVWGKTYETFKEVTQPAALGVLERSVQRVQYAVLEGGDSLEAFAEPVKLDTSIAEVVHTFVTQAQEFRQT